jgi:hypothetical protein
MKQYRVFYRRAGSQNWGTLQPHVHAGLYDNPAVHKAVELIRANPEIGAIAISHDDGLFNVVAFEQEAEAPNSFPLFPPEAAPAQE